MPDLTEDGILRYPHEKCYSCCSNCLLLTAITELGIVSYQGFAVWQCEGYEQDPDIEPIVEIEATQAHQTLAQIRRLVDQLEQVANDYA